MKDAVHASGEPNIPQLAELFAEQLPALLATEFWDLCQQRDKHVEEYYKQRKTDFQSKKTCGRTVDGVILPVAAQAAEAAVPEGMFKHYGRSTARFHLTFLTLAAYTAVPSVLDYS